MHAVQVQPAMHAVQVQPAAPRQERRRQEEADLSLKEELLTQLTHKLDLFHNNFVDFAKKVETNNFLVLN